MRAIKSVDGKNRLSVSVNFRVDRDRLICCLAAEICNIWGDEQKPIFNRKTILGTAKKQLLSKGTAIDFWYDSAYKDQINTIMAKATEQVDRYFPDLK